MATHIKKFVPIILFIVSRCIALSAQTTPVSAPAPISNIHPNTVESSPLQIANTNKAGTIHLGSKKYNMAVTNTLADNIAKAETCSNFYKALQAAGLTETFRSAGPITLFLPDNEAFAKLKGGTVDSLLKAKNRQQLIAFVTYHAIAGSQSFGAIAKQIRKQKNAAVFTTLSGGRLIAKMDGGNIVLVDETGKQATISQSDIKQSNGLVFIISDVLTGKNREI